MRRCWGEGPQFPAYGLGLCKGQSVWTILRCGQAMAAARIASVFHNGRNQAIRLPRDMELNADQVLIEKHGDVLTIRPRPRGWQEYFASANTLDPSFPADIDDMDVESDGEGP